MVAFVYFFCKIIVEIPLMVWRRCKLHPTYRFIKIIEAGITIYTELSFIKALSQVSVQSKLTPFCESSLKGSVSLFNGTKIWHKLFNIIRKTKKKNLIFLHFFGACVFLVSS